MCQLSFLYYQRITDLVLGLIWFIAGALFTIALDRWRYRKARPTARAALEARLYHIARMLVFSVVLLLRKTDEEIKKSIFEFNEDHMVFIFEQTERLIGTYGDLMPIDVKDGLMRLGDKAGYVADAVLHMKMNYEMIEDLDEWKEFRAELTRLISDFDALVLKLKKKGLLSSEFAQHWNLMKSPPKPPQR